MTTMNETSATKAASPLPVVIGSTLVTSKGLVAFAALEKGAVSVGEAARYIRFPEVDPVAEATDGMPPVADWIDNDPHILCRWCHIQVKFGHGPIEFVDWCPICKHEIAEVENG
jgi:hypothetical protein